MAHAAPGLAPGQKVFAADDDVTNVRVAMAPDGYAAAAWVEPRFGGLKVVDVATRTPGGPWSAPEALGTSKAAKSELDLAVNESGAVAVTWEEPGTQVAVATRPAAGAFGSAERWAGSLPRVGISRAGAVTLLYAASAKEKVRSVVAGESFAAAPATDVCDHACDQIDSADLAVAPSGDAIAGWSGGSLGTAEFATRTGGTGAWVTTTPFEGVQGGSTCTSDWSYHDVRVAIDAAGTRAAVVRRRLIQRQEPSCIAELSDQLYAARPSGPNMVAAGEVPAGGGFVAHPAIATGGGETVVAWAHHTSTESVGAVAFPNGTSSFGTDFQPSQTTTAPTGAAPEVAMSASGRALLAWIADDPAPGHPVAYFSVRPHGGAFSAPKPIAGTGADAREPSAGADAAGDGVFGWGQRSTDVFQRFLAHVRGYDAARPRLGVLSISTPSTVGERTSFSASATDVWGPVTYRWRFGDGTGAAGASVGHVYKTADKRTVRLTLRDAVGNVTVATRTVKVRPAAPMLTHVRMKKKRFKVRPHASAFRFTLDRPAMVTIRIERPRAGKPYELVGKLTRASGAGPNQVPFNGKVGGARLAPGKYRATLRGRARGKAGKPRRVKFEVLAG